MNDSDNIVSNVLHATASNNVVGVGRGRDRKLVNKKWVIAGNKGLGENITLENKS